MHSHCFKQHTQEYYTCPLCLKSLGDMTMYFQVRSAPHSDLTSRTNLTCSQPLHASCLETGSHMSMPASVAAHFLPIDRLCGYD